MSELGREEPTEIKHDGSVWGSALCLSSFLMRGGSQKRVINTVYLVWPLLLDDLLLSFIDMMDELVLQLDNMWQDKFDKSSVRNYPP